MTFAYKNIQAFINLLQNNPELFSTQDRETLADKIPEDIESLSEVLLVWCKQRPEINGALRQVRRTLPEDKYKSRGAGGTFPNAQTQEEYGKNLRESYINALRQSSPSANSNPEISNG